MNPSVKYENRRTEAALPALDETVAPIVTDGFGKTRKATVQETRAINMLARLLDDQPAPPQTIFNTTAAPNFFDGVGEPARRSPARKSVSRKAPDLAAESANAGKISAEPQAPAVTEISVRARTSIFASPDFEHMAAPAQRPAAEADYDAPATSRDEVAAMAQEIRQRGGKAEDVAVDELLPFGAATLRLFCY